MTTGEIRDIFVAEYMFESQKRKTERIDMPDGLIAAWLSEAQQEINLRLKPIKTYQDVAITTGVTDYALNANFGKVDVAKLGDADGVIGDTEISFVSISELKSDENTNKCASIYWDSSNQLYYLRLAPTPTEAYYIRIFYYADTLFYSPSGVAAQSWGTFDGVTFTGDMKLPDKYLNAVKFYLMSKCFNDYEVKFEKQISLLRANNTNTFNAKPEYHWDDLS